LNEDAADLLAKTLVHYSLDASPNDVVLISGNPSAEPFLDRLYQLVLEIGARPVVRFVGDLCIDTHLDPHDQSHIGRLLNPTGVASGARIDCSIGVWTLFPRQDHGMPDITDSRHQAERQARFLQSAALGTMRWAVTLWPTDYAAELSGMTLANFEQLLISASMLDCDDPASAWRAIGQQQLGFCSRLQLAKQLRINSPAGTDLIIGVAGRKWINSCGRFNLPDAEIFSSPIEHETHGRWCSSFPTIIDGEIVAGVELEIAAGRVIRHHATEGLTTLTKFLKRDAGASVIGEIGIGNNTRITQGTGISLLDEKIAGTVHIGLGAAYPETGGTNKSSVHRDFVCDLRYGGSFDADGQQLDWRIPESVLIHTVLSLPHRSKRPLGKDGMHNRCFRSRCRNNCAAFW
jgi:aminopeptidase